MKWFFTLLLALPLLSKAQNTAKAPAIDPSDTVKIKRLKNNKPEESNGFKMGTAYDIWENISQTPRLSTLSKTIRSSGLIATFRSRGPLTLFAPDDDAFKKMPKGKLTSLMKKNSVLELSSLLTSQAVPGIYDYGDLEDVASDPAKGKLISLGGNVILVKKQGDEIYLIDEMGNKTQIIASDLKQYNGYIHVINRVLAPKPKIN